MGSKLDYYVNWPENQSGWADRTSSQLHEILIM